MSANDDIFEQMISHQIGVQRLATGTARRMVDIIDKVEDDIIAKLALVDVLPRYKEDRLKRLMKELRRIHAEVYADMGEKLTDEMKAFAVYEGEYQHKAMTAATGLTLDIPSVTALQAAVTSDPFRGRVLKEWLKDLDALTFNRVKDQIKIGFVEGDSVPKIVQRLRGSRAAGYKDGILDQNRRSIETLVRTAVNHTSNAAQAIFATEQLDIAEGERFVAVLDGRTSPICRSLDGKIFEVGKGAMPPLHPNCRSRRVLVLKEEFGGDLQPPRLTYQAWLRGQPAKVQDDILGRSRGKLFRNGGLTLDRFVDRTGAQYTLDELRSREADAFTKARLE